MMILMTLCACGCGQLASPGKKYIRGHHQRGKTKENDEGVRRIAEKKRGKTKENDESVRRMAEKKRGRTKENDEGRRRASEKNRGRPPWNKDKTKENDETVRRVAEKLTGRTKENDEGRRRQAEKLTELWQTDEYVSKMRRACFESPSSYEERIIHLCFTHNLPFKYAGDFKERIANKYPDFIDTNGGKLLIETYTEWCHPSDYETKRAKLFTQEGYRTLFLDDSDLNRSDWEEYCLLRILAFMEMGN